jgi:predicted dehydrogenase
MEIYGATGYVDTVYEDKTPGVKLRARLTGESAEHPETAPTLASPQDNSLNYLSAVLHRTLKPQNDLTSLDTNVTVVRILDAARRSAQTGRTIPLAPTPAPTK